MNSRGQSRLPTIGDGSRSKGNGDQRRSLLPGPSTTRRPSAECTAQALSPNQPDVVSFPDRPTGHPLQIGDRVLISGVKPGVLRYLGNVHFAEGEWCGIELDEPEGKHNGEVEGKKYFQCSEDHRGIFAPSFKVVASHDTDKNDNETDRSPSPDKHSRLPKPRARSSSPDHSSGLQPPQKIKKTLNKPQSRLVPPKSRLPKEGLVASAVQEDYAKDLDATFVVEEPMQGVPLPLDSRAAFTLTYDLDNSGSGSGSGSDSENVRNRTFDAEPSKRIASGFPDLLPESCYMRRFSSIDESDGPASPVVKDVMSESCISVASSLGILTDQDMMNCSLTAEEFRQVNSGMTAPLMLGDDLDRDVEKEIAGMETPEIGSISSAEVSTKEASSPEHETKGGLDLTFDLDDPESATPRSPVRTSNMAGEKMATPVREKDFSPKLTVTEILEEELKSDELTTSLSSVSTLMSLEDRPLSAVMSGSLPEVSPDQANSTFTVVKREKSSSIEEFPCKMRTSADVEDLINQEEAGDASVELAKTAVAQYALLMKEAKHVQPVSEMKRLSLTFRVDEEKDEEESDSVDLVKDSLDAQVGSEEGSSEELEMDDIVVPLKNDDEVDDEKQVKKMAELENRMSESMYEEIRRESELIEEEILHHKEEIQEEEEVKDFKEAEDQLRMDLRDGHMKIERPVSMVSSCSADTGIVADMNALTSSGIWEKDARPTSLISTASIENGYQTDIDPDLTSVTAAPVSLPSPPILIQKSLPTVSEDDPVALMEQAPPTSGSEQEIQNVYQLSDPESSQNLQDSDDIPATNPCEKLPATENREENAMEEEAGEASGTESQLEGDDGERLPDRDGSETSGNEDATVTVMSISPCVEDLPPPPLPLDSPVVPTPDENMEVTPDPASGDTKTPMEVVSSEDFAEIPVENISTPKPSVKVKSVPAARLAKPSALKSRNSVATPKKPLTPPVKKEVDRPKVSTAPRRPLVPTNKSTTPRANNLKPVAKKNEESSKYNPPKSRWGNIVSQIDSGKKASPSSASPKTNISTSRTAVAKPTTKSQLKAPSTAKTTRSKVESRVSSASDASGLSSSLGSASLSNAKSSIAAKKPTNRVTSSLRKHERSSSAESESRLSVMSSASSVNSSQGSSSQKSRIPGSARSSASTRPPSAASSVSSARQVAMATGKRKSLAEPLAPSKIAATVPRRSSVTVPSRVTSSSRVPSKSLKDPSPPNSQKAKADPSRSKAPRTSATPSSVSSLKRPHQPDVLNQALSSAKDEVVRLEALCEQRTKELNRIKMHMKDGALGMQASMVLIQYLTQELSAFSCPVLKEEISRISKQLKTAQSQLEVLSQQRNSLVDEIHSAKSQHQIETAKLITEQKSQLSDLESKLKDEADEGIKQLGEKHKQDRLTQDMMHEKDMLEKQQDHEEAVHKMSMQHTEELQQQQEDHEEIINELQKKHETQLEEITVRFESIKVSLSEKVELLRSECEEMRMREKLYMEECQRELDHKVQQALVPYKHLPQENDSLRTVVDMKNDEIHELRRQKMELIKQLEELPPAREQIRSLTQKLENLEAIIALKGDYEKQLSAKYADMTRRFDRESKANKRLSMNNEELAFRLNQDSSDGCSSPDHLRRTFSSSPTGSDGVTVVMRRRSPLPPASPRSPRSSNNQFFLSPTDNDDRPLPVTGLKRSGTYELLNKKFDDDAAGDQSNGHS